MVSTKWIVNGLVVGCFACCFPGCDFDPMGEKRDERRREAEERAQEAKTQRETESQRDAMLKFATAKRQFFKTRLSEVVEEKNALHADLNKLTTMVSTAMAEKDAQGKERKYESKVLHILKDPEINALAAKYLASDFSGVVATYIERVREARAADAKYIAAVERTEEIYNAGIEETKKWSAMSKRQREGEMVRLRKEIKELEKNRDRVLKDGKNITRHSMVGGGRQNAERFETAQIVNRRIVDVERQIEIKRRQIDYLTNPDVMNNQASRALQAAQNRQENAVDARSRALSDIDRRLKPKKSLTDTVAEFEESTTTKLRKMLSGKIAALDKEEKEFKEKVAMADEILIAIPLYDLGELRRQRQRLEK